MMLVSSILYFNILCLYFSLLEQFSFLFVENFARLNERITVLSSKCLEELKKQGFSDNQLHTEPFLHLRYDGTDCALMCSASSDSSISSGMVHGDFLSGFLAKYLFFVFYLICNYIQM